MKIGPIKIYQRMNCNGVPSSSLLIASLHWKRSLTWRWSLVWSPSCIGGSGINFRRVSRNEKGFNFHCSAKAPILGCLSLQTQRNMFQ